MFRIMGSLEVTGASGPVTVGGVKRRALLAYLLAHAGEVVPRDRLVDDLWDQEPSAAAPHTVQTYVSQLRKLLAHHDGDAALVGRAGGYALELPPGALDARVFERLCTDASCEPSPARRLELLGEALALWRSTPLAEFAGAAWADAFATRLEARRLEAVHERIDALLALGRHSEAVPDLEDLVRDHPLDERFWAQLLVAYFRAGRQSDALRAYQRLRTTLADELGIAPSRELQELERRLLDQDPALLGARVTGRETNARPRTQYAMSGDLAIAYQAFGSGPIDLLVMPTGYSMMEPSWEWPALASFWRRLARRVRIVLIDQRGMGLSDRVTDASTPEERMDDVRAVADAVGARRFALLGGSAGGATSALFAATYPERVLSLVLVSPLLLGRTADGIPGWADDDSGVLWYLHNRWGSGESAELRFAPSLAGDPKAREWVGRMERLAGTPTSMEKVIAMNRKIDVRAAVPTISAPTLVVQRVDDLDVPVEHARYYAEHIANATYLELPGQDHWWWVGENSEEIVQAIETFLTAQRSRPEIDRVLKTVLFVDIPEASVATTRAAVAEHRGVEVQTFGDRFAACFDGPARAISCARAVVGAAADAGVEASAALHTGECEIHGDQLAGMAVRIGRRVSDCAGSGEVLVTGTVRDLVAGSPVDFEDRGLHRFEGIPGEWQLLAVTA
jgi:DNA-binding SARP family transcriptional activator/pimeloyl-ACP methyl ester carboxylesterase